MSVAKRNKKKKCEKRKLRVSRENPSNTGYSTYIPPTFVKKSLKIIITTKKKRGTK